MPGLSKTPAPAARTAAPAKAGKQPAVKAAAPAVKASAPAAQTGRPAVKTAAPAAQTGRPAVKTAAPAVKTAASTAQTGRPAVKTAAPAVKTAAPATQAPAKNVKVPTKGMADLSVNQKSLAQILAEKKKNSMNNPANLKLTLTEQEKKSPVWKAICAASKQSEALEKKKVIKPFNYVFPKGTVVKAR